MDQQPGLTMEGRSSCQRYNTWPCSPMPRLTATKKSIRHGGVWDAQWVTMAIMAKVEWYHGGRAGGGCETNSMHRIEALGIYV